MHDDLMFLSIQTRYTKLVYIDNVIGPPLPTQPVYVHMYIRQ